MTEKRRERYREQRKDDGGIWAAQGRLQTLCDGGFS
jgi:hypothetical protein